MNSHDNKTIDFPPRDKRLRVVMDTDIANEVDDHFAVCEMLLSPERFDVQAVIAAPYLHERVKTHEEGMENSYAELHKLFGIMGRSDFDLIKRGSTHPMISAGNPVISEGAQKIIELAHQAKQDGEKLYIIGIAAVTDIVSALLMAPEIRDAVIICWLGGHYPGPWQNDEYNLSQDYLASQHLFASGVPLIQFPCRNVAQMLSLCEEELKARYCGSATLDYLRERTLADMKLCGNASRSIWDVAPVAWLLDETPFISETLPTPRLELDGSEHKQENAPLYRRIASLQRDPIMEQLLSVLKRAQ